MQAAAVLTAVLTCCTSCIELTRLEVACLVAKLVRSMGLALT